MPALSIVKEENDTKKMYVLFFGVERARACVGLFYLFVCVRVCGGIYATCGHLCVCRCARIYLFRCVLRLHEIKKKYLHK